MLKEILSCGEFSDNTNNPDYIDFTRYYICENREGLDLKWPLMTESFLQKKWYRDQTIEQ